MTLSIAPTHVCRTDHWHVSRRNSLLYGGSPFGDNLGTKLSPGPALPRVHSCVRMCAGLLGLLGQGVRAILLSSRFQLGLCVRFCASGLVAMVCQMMLAGGTVLLGCNASVVGVVLRW